MKSVEGIWVPLITPFDHGKIDVNAVQELASHLIKSGINGLVLAGTTGEGNSLDKNEQHILLAAVREVVGQYYPLMFGIGGSCTRESIDKIKRFKSDPVSGFLISPPSYVRPSQEGVRMHFNALAEATDLPIILYNIPARTGVNMGVDVIATLAKNPQFVAIKECGSQIPDLLALNTLSVLSGNDEMLFSDLRSGASGAISAAAHIRPDLFVLLHEMMSKGHTKLAQVLFEQLLPLIKLLFSEPNPAPVKAALAMQGFITNSLRLPMTPMSTLGKAALDKELERVMNISAGYAHPDFLNGTNKYPPTEPIITRAAR